MLRSTKELFGYDILALDGNIGKVDDIFFQDSDWRVRYLVVDTGPWILGRKVLIVPSALGEPSWASKELSVQLTRDQVKNSPDVQTDKPISERELIKLHDYYDWNKYWIPMPVTTSVPPTSVRGRVEKVEPTAAKAEAVEAAARERQQEPQFALRGAKEVIGYQVGGSDGDLGKVDDFILDDDTWDIRYLVLKTGNILQGKKVLIAPQWVEWIRHTGSRAYLDLDQETIEKSPPFDPDTPINRRQEEVLYDFHGRPYYWLGKQEQGKEQKE